MEDSFAFNRETPIWIYGCGETGKTLCDNLRKAGFLVNGFIDRNVSPFDNCPGLKTLLPNEISEKISPDDIIVLTFQSLHTHEIVAEKLVLMGRKKLVWLYRDTPLFPDTYNIFNDLIQGNVNEEFSFPCATLKLANSTTYCDSRGDFVIVDVPVQLIMGIFFLTRNCHKTKGCDSLKEEAVYLPMGISNNLTALFDYLMNGNLDKNELDNYIAQMQTYNNWNGSAESLMADRKRLFEMYAQEFRERGMMFFRSSAPMAKYDAGTGLFYLLDGRHRSSFLICMKQLLIPLRVSSKDYSLWVNSFDSKRIEDFFCDIKIDSCYTPILNPKYYSIPSLTEKHGRLTSTILMEFFVKSEQRDLSFLDMNSNLGYYSRIIYRLGFTNVTAVEKREPLRKASIILNDLEYCSGISVQGILTIDKKYDVVFWLNDMDFIIDLEHMRFLDSRCRQYFFVRLCDDYSDSIDYICQRTKFHYVGILNHISLSGKDNAIVLFKHN